MFFGGKFLFFFWFWNLIFDVYYGVIKIYFMVEIDIMFLKCRCKGREIGFLREVMLNEFEVV